MSSSTTTQVILSAPSDWRPWFQTIRTAAVQADIWKFVNPDTPNSELPTCDEPEEPTYGTVNPTATGYKDLSDLEREELRDLKATYKRRYKEYREQKSALGLLIKRIQESVDRKQHYLLEDLNTPYELLSSLKKRLSPTQKVRERDLAAAYHKLKKVPRDSDLDDWLSEWQVVYTQCKALDLPEVHDNRASIDFLNAVKAVDIHFAENQLDKIQDLEEEGKKCPDVLQLLDRFETRRRISPPTKAKSQPAFATLQGKRLESKKEVNDSTTPPRPCLCGESHFFVNCPYLIKSIRKPNWKPDVEMLAKIDETVKKVPSLGKAVEVARKKVAARSQNRTQDIGSQGRNVDPPLRSNDETIGRMRGAFATTHFMTAHATSNHTRVQYPLHNSFLLDSASPAHVCNDIARFITFEEIEDYLIAGETEVPILGYGTVEVFGRTPDDKDTFTLTLMETAFIPTFHTSLISLRRAMNAGIHWRIKEKDLSDEIGPMCKVFDMFDQFVIEYNPVQEEFSDTDKQQAFAVSRKSEKSKRSSKKSAKKSSKPLTSSASTDIWHRRLGHVSMEAVNHLSNALTGVNVTKQQSSPSALPSPCEVCTIANLQNQVSRRPAERATEPFERVYFDLIQMTRAYNGDEWAMHFLCDKVRAHFGYTFPSKTDARETVKDFKAFVKRQYDKEILIWHTDGEKSLEKAEFGDWLRKEGYIYETTAPYSPSQNGPAERAGGVIIRKARAMRIEAKLPENLWPEFFNTAVYITNRTPTKQLGWLTPLEVLHQELGRANPRPTGAHLRILGCRAYNKILNLPKKHKVAPRSLIGYLVGYDSTNIFRVWIPQKRKVIRTKDVIFDENKFYPAGSLYRGTPTAICSRETSHPGP